MRIDELKRIAEENEYELTECLEQYKFVRRSKILDHRITIGKVRANGLWISIKVWCDEKDFNMIKAAVEFAETPPEDREEEKKFYLKHRWIKGCVIMYLYRNELNGYCYLGDKKCRPHRQKRFTLKEIEEIKEKFDTDLKDFEVVEVKE